MSNKHYLMKRFPVLVFIILFSGQLIFSQNRIYTTQRILSNDINIDGIFDEEAWSTVKWADDFTQNMPDNGAKPSQETAFKIVYDDNFIFVAIKAYDTEPGKIDRKMSRRDGWEGDMVAIEIDSYNDKRTAFVFGVSASGVKNDGIIINNKDETDDSRDPIWFVKTHIDKDGWKAEMKIPLSQLRFSSASQQIWGLQVVRFYYRNQEFHTWQHIPDEASGWVSNYSELNGISELKPKRQIEVAPYIMSNIEVYEKEEGNPFQDGKDYNVDAGLDGKIGITNDLILDFTVNPDFGQVEADPSEVNLTAFETFFDEKRPFFIEGSNITDYQLTAGNSPWSSDNLFYSRRIGRAPQYQPDLDEGEYIDLPNNTRILGAVKLTGKTKNGWSVGIMESVTNNEWVEIDRNGNRSKEIAEPLSNYFLGRVQKDINSGNTIIGGMITSSYRNIKDNHLLFLNKKATSGGVDFIQYFREKKYYVSSKFAFSKISGDTEAILDQQLSSRRYFQRPDANYLNLDSSRTSLSGHAGSILFGKQANSGLRYDFNLTWRSPGYETNDMGYLRQANTAFHYFWIGYLFTKPFSIFRNMGINANEWAGWDFGPTTIFFGGNVNAWAQFRNLWSVNLNVTRERESIDNSALRGGPSFIYPGNWNFSGGFGSNSTKKLFVHCYIWNNKNDEGSGNSWGFGGIVTFKPTNSLSFSLEPSYSDLNYDLQYINQETIGDEDRYIFAEISQDILDLVIRANYFITPNLSIQYYGSPFVSGGLYDNFKIITDPDATDYADRFHIFGSNQITYFPGNENFGISESGNGNYDYYIDKPDFNFRQFRSNLVLRWEYKPGSLIYLVWSQTRTESVNNGEFNYTQDIGDLFSVRPYDVFLVKLSYRFGN